MARPLWTSEEIAAATGGKPAGAAFAATGVSIDTRTLEPGDLFVALGGARDGHEFVAQAMEQGAVGALASRQVFGPAVMVDDTLKALERLGAAARDRAAKARRGAVTGSVGKTSVTQAVMAGLTLAGRAHSSVKSYNNHIGVPLTLARMPADTQRAVFEIGMNHADEIRPLTRMVRPHAALVTTVGPVHTENFADGEAGVAAAKAEVFEGLEPGGVAVLNADNRWFGALKDAAEKAGAQVRTFGRAKGCDAQLIDFQGAGDHAVVQARFHGKGLDFPILQTGMHWGLNSMAVLLMLEALDVDLGDSLAALGSFEPLAGRGAERAVHLKAGDFTLIDESYNANPISMASAIATLGARRTGGRRIVALTDMLELGGEAKSFHAALAEPLAEAGVDLVFCAGPLMKSLWDALPATRRGGYAETAAELSPLVARAAEPGDVVMVKGSNGSKAGQVAQALAALDAGRGSGGGRLMFYWLYEHFSGGVHGHHVPVLNLLRYLTFRTIMATATAQFVVVLMGSRFIRWMQAKQGKGQPIRAEGIERHVLEKAGTPTMGGVMILAGLFAGALLWADLGNVYIWAVLLVTGGYGFLGFLDDYAKVTKQSTAGISGRMRIVLEALIAVAAVALIILFAGKAPDAPDLLTSVAMPLFKQALLNLHWFYLAFGAFIIVGAANAVNFTDGLDGLATVPVMIAAAAYGFIAYLVGNFVFANYLQLHQVPGVGEVAIYCGAMIGSGLGFLWYNAPPAKIFMGDTGALALGGGIGAVAVATRQEVLLGVIGGLFVAETLSVIIQVAWFKRTGRRIFLMAPIHHHFEKLGWSELTVVIRFWIVSIMLALMGLATLKLR